MTVKTLDATPPLEPVRTANKAAVLMVLFMTWMVGTFDKVAINVAAIPISGELGFTSQQIGLIMSSFFLSYAVMNLIGGVIADRLGYKKVIITIIALWSFFTGITGFLSSFAAFIVIRFLFGLSEGGFPPSGSVVIAQVFPKAQRGRAKAFLVSASILGIGFGTMIVSAITANYGWRMSFYLFSGTGLICCLAFWLCVKGVPDKEDSSAKSQARQGIWSSIVLVFRIPMIWKLTIVYFGCGVVNWGLSSWMPTYWVKEMGLDLVTMGALQVIPPLSMFAFMQVAGFILDKFMVGREKYLIFAGGLMVALCTYLMFQTRSVPLALTYQTFVMVSMAFITSTVFVLPLKYLPRNMVGSATGLINFGQQIAGACAPAIIGFLIASTQSYQLVCTFVIVVILVSSSMSLFIKSKEIRSDRIRGM